MSFERTLDAVPPTLFTANGTANGLVQVASTAGFYVKTLAIIQAPLLPPMQVEIKRVIDQHNMWVGPVGAITLRSDISAYTVSAGSFMFSNENPKAAIPMETRMLASYIQEPSNSWRVSAVDEFGNFYSASNPLPVTGGGSSGGGGLTPANYDDVKIIRDSNDLPTQYQFYLAAVLVGSINVFYNANTSAIEYKKV